MTIRDIGILFGYKVDQSSEQKVEGSIKSLKSMASKVLGAVGITLSVAGIKSAIDGCVEVASSIEEMQNKFDVVFGDMRDEVDKWAQEYSDAIGRNKNDIKTYLADQQNLLVGFGMTRQAGAEMAEQMTSLALDLAGQLSGHPPANPGCHWRLPAQSLQLRKHQKAVHRQAEGNQNERRPVLPADLSEDSEHWCKGPDDDS